MALPVKSRQNLRHELRARVEFRPGFSGVRFRHAPGIPLPKQIEVSLKLGSLSHPAALLAPFVVRPFRKPVFLYPRRWQDREQREIGPYRAAFVRPPQGWLWHLRVRVVRNSGKKDVARQYGRLDPLLMVLAAGSSLACGTTYSPGRPACPACFDPRRWGERVKPRSRSPVLRPSGSRSSAFHQHCSHRPATGPPKMCATILRSAN